MGFFDRLKEVTVSSAKSAADAAIGTATRTVFGGADRGETESATTSRSVTNPATGNVSHSDDPRSGTRPPPESTASSRRSGDGISFSNPLVKWGVAGLAIFGAMRLLGGRRRGR